MYGSVEEDWRISMTLLVIRISGMVDVPYKVAHTLDHMRLRRKFSAILMPETIETTKILHKVRSFVAFGKISDKCRKSIPQVIIGRYKFKIDVYSVQVPLVKNFD